MIELKKLNVHRIVDSEETAARLEADGFTVARENVAPAFASMKVAELRAYAEKKGVSLGGATKKEDIVKAIQASLAAEEAKAAANAAADAAK
jgi:hypothetical protein